MSKEPGSRRQAGVKESVGIPPVLSPLDAMLPVSFSSLRVPCLFRRRTQVLKRCALPMRSVEMAFAPQARPIGAVPPIAGRRFSPPTCSRFPPTAVMQGRLQLRCRRQLQLAHQRGHRRLSQLVHQRGHRRLSQLVHQRGHRLLSRRRRLRPEHLPLLRHLATPSPYAWSWA